MSLINYKIENKSTLQKAYSNNSNMSSLSTFPTKNDINKYYLNDGDDKFMKLMKHLKSKPNNNPNNSFVSNNIKNVNELNFITKYKCFKSNNFNTQKINVMSNGMELCCNYNSYVGSMLKPQYQIVVGYNIFKHNDYNVYTGELHFVNYDVINNCYVDLTQDQYENNKWFLPCEVLTEFYNSLLQHSKSVNQYEFSAVAKMMNILNIQINIGGFYYSSTLNKKQLNTFHKRYIKNNETLTFDEFKNNFKEIINASNNWNEISKNDNGLDL
tara:strand:- start:176 stop:985 length:810 start_codon:yes stop_codon:yes gene_type:complete